MHIGLIGIGKMGQEILNILFENGHKVSVVGQEIDMKFKEKFENKLSRQVKKKLITEEEYNQIKLRFEISTDLEVIRDCDIVIEAIYEDIKAKGELFKKVENIVSEKCILVSNTSSLPLASIFKECKLKSRCAGLHFFFPVKITSVIEINKTSETNTQVMDMLKNLVISVDKQYIVFEESNNMYLNKVLSILTTQAYYMCNKYNISMIEMNRVSKEKLCMFGLFEVVDSVGLEIICKSLEAFSNERYEKLFMPFYNECKGIIYKGYSGVKAKGILDYYTENKCGIASTPIEENQLILEIISVLVNEIIYMVHTNCDIKTDVLISAISDIVGLNRDIDEYISIYGYKAIIDSLTVNYEETQMEIYKPFDFELYKKIFNVEESV